MTWRSPGERQRGAARARRAAALLVLGYFALRPLDGPIARAMPGKEIEAAGWYQMLRSAGYLPTWLLVAAAIWLASRRNPGLTERPAAGARCGFVALMAAGSGVLAEVLQPILGRERPGPGGEAVWRSPPLVGGFLDMHGLGLPSSHAAVAFGGAFALALAYAGAWPVALAASLGCALTRVASGAHFMTDVYVSAAVAYGLVRASSGAFGLGAQRERW